MTCEQTFSLSLSQIDHWHLSIHLLVPTSHKRYILATCHRTCFYQLNASNKQGAFKPLFWQHGLGIWSESILGKTGAVDSHLEHAETGLDTLSKGVSAELGPDRCILIFGTGSGEIVYLQAKVASIPNHMPRYAIDNTVLVSLVDRIQ